MFRPSAGFYNPSRDLDAVTERFSLLHFTLQLHCVKYRVFFKDISLVAYFQYQTFHTQEAAQFFFHYFMLYLSCL